MAALPYLQQRFHSGLTIDSSACVTRGLKKIPFHCQQGDFDGACAQYCAAMSLTLLGRIRDPTVLSNRARGVAARLWRATQSNFFSGTTVQQLSMLLKQSDCSLNVKACRSDEALKIAAFVKKEMANDHLVIVSWLASRGNTHHWILLVGVEGILSGGKFRPATFLALDPSIDAPILTGYNGRLNISRVRSNQVIASKMTYEAAWQSRINVSLTAALSLY